MAEKLTILTYHRVLSEPDPLRAGDIQVESFRRQMRTLARYFNVLPLVDAAARLRQGSLPSRAICVTFDDGYSDNYRTAWPVLRQYGIPATIFIATEFLDGGRMWNDTVIESLRRIRGDTIDLQDLNLGCHGCEHDSDRAAAVDNVIQQLKYMEPGERNAKALAIAEKADSPVPNDLMLESSQVRELSESGVEIGAHTISHPILKSIDADSAAFEIGEGKKRLEQVTGATVRSFAYPNGKPGVDYDKSHVELVKAAGFVCAVSTASGSASRSSDILQLPRFGPWAEPSVRFALRMLRMSYANQA